MKKTALALLVAVGAAAATVNAQSFTLIQTENFDLLMDDPSGNDSFWIGNNPSAIAFDGTDLYIGGFHNGTAPWVQVVKVEDVLTNRQFRALIDQSDPLNPNQDPNISSRRQTGNNRGISGLDLVSGVGLVMTADLGGFGPIGQVMTWDIDTQENPIPLQTSQDGESPRGIAGPSWDLGFNGGGFTWDLGGGDTGTNDPVVGVLDFTSDPRGPLGLSPNTLSGAVGATVYEVDSGGPQIDGGGLSGTIWRDLDIDPNTGNIAARAANDLVIARRASDNTVASKVVVDGGDAPFVVGQNVNIVHGLCTGDVVIWNNRPDSGARSFADSVRWSDLDGNAVNVELKNADGSAFSPAAGVGYYDFSWDEGSGILAIMDFANRNVHFFQADCDDGCGLADYNNDGVIDTRDFLAYLNDWNAGSGDADCNGDGTINTQDVLCFLNLWNSCR